MHWPEASGVVKRRKEQAATGKEWYRERAPEKPLSPSVTTEIMNIKAVIPQSSNKHKHCFGSSCSMSQAIFSSAYASGLVFNRHGRQAKPHKVQPLVHDSWKHCLFSKAKLVIQTSCVDSVKSIVLGEGRADPHVSQVSKQVFFPFKQGPQTGFHVYWLVLHIFSHWHN